MANGTVSPPDMKPKSFWKRPEGVTGMIFLTGLVVGGGYLLTKILPTLLSGALTALQLGLVLMALAALVYIVLDPKTRNLIWYMYKSVMRWVTGLFVQIDPIGILKSYVDDLQDNLGKMSKQIGVLKGQMRKMKTLMEDNNKEINNSLSLARKAKELGQDSQVILNTRKAARLKENNEKFQVLYNKMTVMSRVLTKMYQNSEILLEDTKDQVMVKEQERKMIRASHSAMRSAMSVISGDPDKRAMFDMAMENIAEDVANKVGEMERFMEISSNFMNSIDLQNASFEDQGMKMLEKWEKESTSFLLGDDKFKLLNTPEVEDSLDLNQSFPEAETRKNTDSGDNQYKNLFD
jgi:predicted  nucleic acid-binding Zn-ribbon protein